LKLSDDQKSVEISVSGALSATDVETLLADLMELRANMLPPVPEELPKPGTKGAALSNVSSQDDPYLSARLLRDGRIRLWLRNAGIGWMAFNLPVDKACTLRDYLIANTPEKSPGPNLFADNFGEGGTPH